MKEESPVNEIPHAMFQPVVNVFIDGTVEVDWSDCFSCMSEGASRYEGELSDKMDDILGIGQGLSTAATLHRLADWIECHPRKQTRTITITVDSTADDDRWKAFMRAVTEDIEQVACDQAASLLGDDGDYKVEVEG